MWRWDQQEPFGNNPADENPSGLGAFDLPLRLPGQRYDAETGLHHNYFRDYDPSLGIYKQSDPIGLEGGLNTYAYVKASPLGAIDPLGLRVGGGKTLLQRVLEGLRREQVPSEAGAEGAALPHIQHAKNVGEQIGLRLCRGSRDYITECLDECVKTFNPNGVVSEGGGAEINACVGSCRSAYVRCKYPPSSSCVPQVAL